MTITQPVNKNKTNKDRPKSINTPAHSSAQEAANSQNSTLIVHPNSGVQHTINVAPVPGQHQLQLHHSSLPWWAWGPPPPPNPWNWNMWSPGAIHQLSPTNPTGQHTISQTAGMPNQFVGFLSTTIMATSTVTASTATTAPVQQEHQSQEKLSPPYQSPSASSNSASPVSNPPDNTEEEQLDPLFSTLSFLTAPGKLPEPLLSMHVSVSIKKRIWVGQYVDFAYLLETQPVPDDKKAYEFSCSNSNTNKLSLTMAKPKAKVDSYNS